MTLTLFSNAYPLALPWILVVSLGIELITTRKPRHAMLFPLFLGLVSSAALHMAPPTLPEMQQLLKVETVVLFSFSAVMFVLHSFVFPAWKLWVVPRFPRKQVHVPHPH